MIILELLATDLDTSQLLYTFAWNIKNKDYPRIHPDEYDADFFLALRQQENLYLIV